MKSFIGLVLFLAIFPSLVLAARPLSTDDAGTVERQHMEVESGFEYADKADDEYNWTMTFKYGLGEKWDFGVEIPYQYIDISEGDDVDGLADITFCSKYRLLDETEDFPALSFNFSIKTKTGNKSKGLSTGALDYALNTILSKEWDKIVTHLNLGYTRVGGPEATKDDDLFSYALALEYPANDRLNLVGELIAETNFEGDFDDNPFAGLVGINYACSDRTTFDLGVGWGISEASTDFSITTGLTLAF